MRLDKDEVVRLNEENNCEADKENVVKPDPGKRPEIWKTVGPEKDKMVRLNKEKIVRPNREDMMRGRC